MKKIIALILFFSGIFSVAHSQIFTDSIPESNYMIYLSLVEKGIYPLCDEMTIIGRDKIFFIENMKSSEEVSFICDMLKNKMRDFKIVGNNLIPDSSYTVKFTDLKFETKYSNIKKSSLIKRELNREILVKFQCKIYFRDSLVYSYYFNDKSDSKFDFTYLNYVEAGDRQFLKGEVPEATFRDKYITPIVVISASVIAVILFFVIRSK